MQTRRILLSLALALTLLPATAAAQVSPPLLQRNRPQQLVRQVQPRTVAPRTITNPFLLPMQIWLSGLQRVTQSYQQGLQQASTRYGTVRDAGFPEHIARGARNESLHNNALKTYSETAKSWHAAMQATPWAAMWNAWVRAVTPVPPI